MKLNIFLICLFTSALCYGKVTEKEKLALRELTKEEISLLLKKTNKELENQKEDIVPGKVSLIADSLKNYYEHPFVEADTGFKRKWYKSMYDLIEKMATIKSKQETAKKLKNRKVYSQCKKAYSGYLSSFYNIAKKPKKVDRKELVRLRREARRKRKEIEKKMKLEGIETPKAPAKSAEPDRRGKR